jgi:hypothetical protein
MQPVGKLEQHGSISNGKLAIGGLVAIVLLAAVGVAVTSRLSDLQPTVGGGRVSTPDPSARAVGGPLPASAVTAKPAAAMRLIGGIGQVTPVTRRESARVGRTEMVAGFSALRELVQRCNAQDASFVLELAASAGSVRVEGARLEERGPVSDAALACADSALGGQTFAAPNVPAGRRWEVSFSAGSP